MSTLKESIKRPIPKPRSINTSLPRNMSGSLYGNDSSTADSTHFRQRANTCSGSQGPQPLPRRQRSVLTEAKLRGTSSADSSPQALRSVTQVPQSMDSHKSNWSPQQVPEATKKLPGSPKTIKNSLPMNFKNLSIDSRLRTNTEPRMARKPPEKPPPYVPKKKKNSLEPFQSKTPSAILISDHTSPNPTSPLRQGNAYTPSPSLNRNNSSTIQNSDLFKVKRQDVIEIGDVRHDYEDVDDLFKKSDSTSSLEYDRHDYEYVENPFQKFDSSSSLDHDEPEKTQLIAPSSSPPPVLPPRTLPVVNAKKHRLLTNPRSPEKSTTTLKVKIQRPRDYEAVYDQPQGSDCESDDSYTAMDPSGVSGIQLDSDIDLEDDQPEDVYIQMNPAEFIAPPNI